MQKTILILANLLLFSSVFSQENTSLPKNNITIKPFNINSVGTGIGAQYERYIDNTNNFSLVFPLDYSFDVTSNQNGFSEEIIAYGININPGFRFYFIEPKSFNWFLGTSFLFGYEDFTYSPIGQVGYNKSTTKFGTLINIGFKGTIKNKFTYSLELGNGIKFLEKTSSNNVIINTNNNRYLGSLCVGFGYNF